MKFSEIIRVVYPEYIYLKLKPNKAIRNNNTHKIARTIASLHKSITENLRKEEVKVVKLFGKSITVPTKVSYRVGAKAAYFICVEKKKVEFYFIVPRHQLRRRSIS